jgi:hypothetical protein
VSVQFKSTYPGRAKVDSVLDEAIFQGVKETYDLILGEAVRRAPIDTSALRQSGQVDVRRSKGDIEARVYFDAPYAEVQHEGDFQHPQGGERFYLANALKVHAKHLGPAIARRIRKLKTQ